MHDPRRRARLIGRWGVRALPLASATWLAACQLSLPTPSGLAPARGDGGLDHGAAQRDTRTTDATQPLPHDAGGDAASGGAWKAVTSSVSESLYGLWGTDASNLWAVGAGGVILRCQGGSWSRATSPTSAALQAVWGDGAGHAFAVGAGGTILALQGESWRAEASPVTTDLTSVWGSSPSSVWSVGSGGAILRYDGTSWTRATSPTTSNLLGVWASSSGDEAWAVGEGGTILRHGSAPGAWVPDASPSGSTLRAVWGRSAERVWIVGHGVILTRKAGAWDKLNPAFTAKPFRAIAGRALPSLEDDVWTVGSDGNLARLLGGTWAPQPSGSSATLHALWIGASGEGWIAGGGGTLLQYRP
ncbi:MAG: hypothetical protein IT371_26625 [Deltaproteobacteria bacterium]|nr:hypothetical protein [Deltaproteobacteria bacterium]